MKAVKKTKNKKAVASSTTPVKKKKLASSRKKARVAWYQYALGIPYAFAILLVAFFIVFFVAAMWPHGASEELVDNHRNIMGYLTIPLYAPDSISYLEADEYAHMVDVKVVFNWAFIAMLLFAGIAMIFPSRIAKQTSAGIIGGLAIITLLCSLIDVRWAWAFFHKIFFPQGGWMFPEGSLFMTLYPGTYFATFVLASFVLAIIIVGLLNWHHKANEPKKKSKKK